MRLIESDTVNFDLNDETLKLNLSDEIVDNVTTKVTELENQITELETVVNKYMDYSNSTTGALYNGTEIKRTVLSKACSSNATTTLGTISFSKILKITGTYKDSTGNWFNLDRLNPNSFNYQMWIRISQAGVVTLQVGSSIASGTANLIIEYI